MQGRAGARWRFSDMDVWLLRPPREAGPFAIRRGLEGQQRSSPTTVSSGDYGAVVHSYAACWGRFRSMTGNHTRHMPGCTRDVHDLSRPARYFQLVALMSVRVTAEYFTNPPTAGTPRDTVLTDSVASRRSGATRSDRQQEVRHDILHRLDPRHHLHPSGPRRLVSRAIAGPGHGSRRPRHRLRTAFDSGSIPHKDPDSDRCRRAPGIPRGLFC